MDTIGSSTEKLIVFLTKSCNRNCLICIDKPNYEYYKKLKEYKEFMDLGTIKKVLEFSKNHNIRFIQLNGGEPTLHPQIIDFSKMIRDAGFSPELVTNYDFPEVVNKLDGIMDRIYVSYYNQETLPQQANFKTKILLRIVLTKSNFPSLETLANFIQNNKESFYSLKITTLINNNAYSQSEQVDYLGELEREYPLYEDENGKKYHYFMGFKIKRLDLENLKLDINKTSFKVHVNGTISHYSEEDYYELGGMDPNSTLTKVLQATRNADRRSQIMKSFDSACL